MLKLLNVLYQVAKVFVSWIVCPMMSIICQPWKITSNVNTGTKHQNDNPHNVSICSEKLRTTFTVLFQWFWILENRNVYYRVAFLIEIKSTIKSIYFSNKNHFLWKDIKSFLNMVQLYFVVCLYLKDCKLFSESFVQMCSQYTENDQYYFHKWNLFYLLSQLDSFNPTKR